MRLLQFARLTLRPRIGKGIGDDAESKYCQRKDGRFLAVTALRREFRVLGGGAEEVEGVGGDRAVLDGSKPAIQRGYHSTSIVHT